MDIRIKASAPAIAVIGMGCWYPNARNLQQLWENILARRQQFRRTPDQRLPLSDYYDPDSTVPDKTYGSRMAVIDGFEFDWVSKRIPKTVVETADIAHWVALEVALQALEDSGYTRTNIPTERTGVLVGNTMTGEFSRSTNLRLRWPYVKRALIAAAEAKSLPPQLITSLTETMEEYYKSVFSPITEDTLSGNLSNTIAGRICNFFNFHGGGYTVDGACSSSLIAVANAATALTNGDLDLAFAGGVDISLDTFELIGFAKTGALTNQDMTVYDRKASGFIPGEGCGFVVLKRLEDARADGNYVYAVLNGWGISSDGKGGLTAPSSEGQAGALRRAYDRADYSPHTVDFIEGHGTGTFVGDRVELEGIALAMNSYGEAAPRSCGVTSFKSIVGHTKAAAGVGALIKAVMAVNRRILPPLAGCKEPNAVFKSSAHCLYPILQGEVRSQNESLRAGVTSAGFGGINCHVTLESGDAPAVHLQPSIEERSLLVSSQETEIFVLSAASISDLLRRTWAVRKTAEGLSVGELIDLAAHLTRELEPQLRIRATVIAGTPEQLIESLNILEKLLRETPPSEGQVVISPNKEVWLGNAVRQNRVGFLFPGQGSQRLNMARSLVERYNWAQELVEQTDTWLRDVGVQGVRESIYVPLDRAINEEQVAEWSRKLAQTEVAQPAICLNSLLWMRYLDRLGVKPVAVGGHSLGELSAFHAAGAFDEKTLLCLAAVRGQAMSVPVNGNNGPGAMASLTCSRQTAEALLERVSGYAVLANINSPQQMVISGKQTSVEQVMELATTEGIRTVQLPVSNGFHSQLVSAAAERLGQHELMPDTLEKMTVPLFSSVDGRQPLLGLPLREYFANQVLAQVDFVSLVKTLVQTCDVLIEVGPGKVLSGLVNDIVGPNGPHCFPVESKPGLDKDLNTMLSALFVYGGEINWETLYENRLVHPFVLASERAFIVNPLERPFQVSTVNTSPTPQVSEFALHSSVLTQQSQVPWELLSDYFTQRGKFITEVIRADLQTLPLLSASFNPSKVNQPGGVSHVSIPDVPKSVPEQSVSISSNRAASIETLLVNLIAQQTGFPQESITLQIRLLDDLNLDSIKAGEVIATAAKEVGVAGIIDPTTLANATLQEIADTLRIAISERNDTSNGGAAAVVLDEANGAKHGSTVTLRIEDLLINLIAQQTGFPQESITLQIRLLDDLNLDSIKAGEVIATAAKEVGVAGIIDPTTLANATIQEVAEALRIAVSERNGTSNGGAVVEVLNEANGTKNRSAVILKEATEAKNLTDLPVAMPENKRQAQVRDYIVQAVVEEFTPVTLGKHSEEKWQTANVLILCESGELGIAEALCGQLHSQGALVQTVSFAEAGTQALIESIDFTHFVAVLPRTTSVESSTDGRLLDMIERLRSVATPPAIAGASREHTTVAYVQFGGGHFGTQPPLADIEQCCAIGFAASVHLERADLKVRVIDFSPTVIPTKLAECVIRELSTAHVYMTAGYDEHLTRYVPRPQVQEPVKYQSRGITWSSDDVVLVTGGGKGITAECALALARDTGVRMALIGRSPHPNGNIERRGGGSAEIARTLERFNAEGLICQYYECDISDFDSVASLIKQVQQDLGEIAGVLHGAALNKPRLVEQVSAESAFDEVKPKLKGVLNLCQALANTSLKLFAGFSSVIGITGMQRNAWYGFANETLDLILRRFKAQHPQTATIAIAFSVWEEVGMGVRMGSVRNLAKIGIKAIPKDVGVARFLHLIKNDPGDIRIVVAAPMQALSAFESSGLDTWYPQRFLPRAELKFLERILLCEPGVEIVARAHLSLERDSYLLDHLYKGSYLFPTVFGLEAMAQAVAYVTQQPSFPAIRIEDVRLERPIVVDPDKGVDIEIRAEVPEQEFKNSLQRVYVTIKTEQTGFAINHFSATFVLGVEKNPPKEYIKLPEAPLDIEPQADLYSWLLFQGSSFQRLQQIYTLNSRECVFRTQINSFSVGGKQDSLNRAQGPFWLGDPYCRDSLLQVGQLVIPQDICLPIHIDSIDIYQPNDDVSSYIGITKPQGREGKQYNNSVFATTPDGQLVERLNGYQLRILEHRKDNPTVEELADPSQRDEWILRRKLSNQAQLFRVAAPEVSLAYFPRIHALSATERHERELPLFHKTIGQLLRSNSNLIPEIQIKWTKSGKPMVDGLEDQGVEVSLSHEERVCICVAGRGPQGCDIESVTHRTREDWTALLSNSRDGLMQQLLSSKSSVAHAGTRIWTAVEALRKAIEAKTINLVIDRIEGDSVLFLDTASNGQLKVLTFPVRLTRDFEKMVALVVQDIKST
ncbi:type I polyketide synthase [Nostoc sp. WHI]|uniref:type I polyketide synthase n=1 Tax=Nostoc sp. WHI TaxID=2650611 RepID=UPI0018C6166F|nr:type I polyketide synthase [Nostoc sp. WHI]MBG1269561.1 SDR family NAD(P)-dependent oxidoreductase [Nostoc sp. WHI]